LQLWRNIDGNILGRLEKLKLLLKPAQEMP